MENLDSQCSFKRMGVVVCSKYPSTGVWSNAEGRQADPGDSLDSQSIEMASSGFSKRACLKRQGDKDRDFNS